MSTKYISEMTFEFGDLNGMNSYLPRPILDENVMKFLNELSRTIFRHKDARNYPDVIAFAFWCRHSSLNQVQKMYDSTENRLGLGTVFHITPSNVPVNFAFSWAFGLLAGNRNIVRLPSSEFRQIDLILECILTLSMQDEYSDIAKSSIFLRYAHNDSLTKFIQDLCRARVIWGSDATVKHLKTILVPNRFIDVAFPSRISSAFISVSAILELSELELTSLVVNFIKDAMTFDQRGCSSPKQIFWIGDLEDSEIAQNRFWLAASKQIRNQELLQPSHVSERLTILSMLAAKNENSVVLENSVYDSLMRIRHLERNRLDLETTAVLGTFEQGAFTCLNEALKALQDNCQTLTYFGLSPNEILAYVVDLGISGVDRIVPFGQAFEMSTLWDGHDMIRSLSRVIELRKRLEPSAI